ncbi:hypothetical protein N0V84_002859 [Fusarium piperis]|uniref:Uncharacterized protein n=1 Tax=Fusarium piperis TaxID=1435070 RepID=A0A9W8WIF9_9HYPO|nr:hypothetical protein N0V84_002859 [Fusarium piperis]
MLGRVKDDLCPRNVKFRLEGGVYRYEEAFRLTAEIGDYVESMVSRGLGMAIRLLSIDDDEQLAMEFRQSLFREKCPDASLKEAVSMDAQRISRYDMPRILPGRVEVMGGEYMGFMGDSVLPTEPPQAWVQLWGEMYSTIYGEYIPESVQRWGYVMWNKDRWNVPGGDKLVVKQWRQYPHCIYEVMEDYGWTPGI